MKNHQSQSGLPINQFGQDSQIPIDKKLHVVKPLDGNRISAPLMWSICIHIAIVAFVIYANLIPEISQQPVVETMLYTSDELTKLQSDIQANRATVAAQSIQSDGTDSNSKTVNSKTANTANKNTPRNNSNPAKNKASKSADSLPKIQISPEMQAINDRIAEQQRQFDQAMKRSADKVDSDVKKEKQQRLEAIQKKEKKRQQTVEEFKQAEQKSTTEEEPNLEEAEPLSFEELKEDFESRKEKETAKNSTLLKQKKQPEKEQIIRKSMGVGQSVTSRNNNRSRYTNGSAATNRGARTKNINVDAAIATKIKRNLIAPQGSRGFTSTVTIYVDSSGFVENASVVGENLALNDASKQAVYRSSPLPTAGSNRRTFVVRLHGR